MDPATPQQLVDVGADVMRTHLDPTGTGAVDLTDGSDNTALLSVSAAMAMRNVSTLHTYAAARWRSSATGEELRRIAREVYTTDRKPESFATVVMYLKRPNAAAGAGPIPAGTRFAVRASASQQAVTFAADADVAVGSGTTKVAVPCTCLVAGEIGNVAYEAIVDLGDDLFDDTLVVFTPTTPTDADVLGALSAPERAAGGASEETDDVLNARLDQFPANAARRPGTEDAIRFAVLEVPGVRYATIVAPGDGTIRAFVGDAAYGLNQALADAVRDNLDKGTYSAAGAPGYRGMAIPVFVLPYTRTRVYATATLYMDRPNYEYDVGALKDKAIALGTEYFAARSHADEFVQRKVEEALLSCHEETQEIELSLSPAPTVRAPSSSYAGVTQIVRYFVDEASWDITFTGPKTT